MAPMRLTCWFILLLLIAWFSNIKANAHQDGDAAIEVDDVLRGKVKTVSEVLDGEPISTVGREVSLGGRRRGSVDQARRSVKVKEFGVSGQRSQLAAREQEHQKKSIGQFSEQVDQKEFVAFNADYRAPRHHPPKNN